MKTKTLYPVLGQDTRYLPQTTEEVLVRMQDILPSDLDVVSRLRQEIGHLWGLDNALAFEMQHAMNVGDLAKVFLLMRTDLRARTDGVLQAA